MKRKDIYDNVFNYVSYSRDKGIGHLASDVDQFDGKHTIIEGKSKTGFVLCDYLGLSTDKRVKEGAIKAIEKYGVFTSASRTFMRIGFYDEIEELLSVLFGKPTILISRTSLAHISTIPIITNENDAILLDHQVHMSVRNAVEMVQSHGNYVENIRHNDIPKLEERIIELSKKHDKIWYMSDGVHSMHGDFAPYDDLKVLLDKYEKFHLYIDDAHGMSWNGENGRGVVLDKMGFHDKMMMASSLAKGFGTGGAVIICPNQALKDRILLCGAPLMFSGPVAPPTLGAIKASALIHLSPEIYTLQNTLNKLMLTFRRTSKILDLPLIDDEQSPIFFIAAGKPNDVIDISKDLLDNGYHVSASAYPSVPFNNGGVRCTVNVKHTEQEIIDFLHFFRKYYDNKMESMGRSQQDIMRFFKHVKPINVSL